MCSYIVSIFSLYELFILCRSDTLCDKQGDRESLSPVKVARVRKWKARFDVRTRVPDMQKYCTTYVRALRQPER